MPKDRRFEEKKRGGYYAMVEEKIGSLAGSNYSRSVLLLDGVDAESFEANPRSIEDEWSLGLIEIMSTEGVWDNRSGFDRVTPGDWVQIELDDDGGAPLAWEMQASNDYRRGTRRSLRSLRRIGRMGTDDQPTGVRPDLVRSLHVATSNARGVHQTASLQAIGAALLASPDGNRQVPAVPNIEVWILDVGQASCSMVLKDGVPVLLFDAGAPIWFNKGSVDLGFVPPDIGDSAIFLSHWDFDHFDLGRRMTQWHSNRWYAPDQPVSPNTAYFQKKLGTNLTFVDGKLSFEGFSFERGNAVDPTDRNNTGYQMRYQEGTHVALLTGDADYAFISPNMKSGLTHLCIPHHGGRGTTPPAPAGHVGRAVVSHGTPNRYKHPHPPQIRAHRNAGWIIRTTATGIVPRGDRILFPL